MFTERKPQVEAVPLLANPSRDFCPEGETTQAQSDTVQGKMCSDGVRQVHQGAQQTRAPRLTQAPRSHRRPGHMDDQVDQEGAEGAPGPRNAGGLQEHLLPLGTGPEERSGNIRPPDTRLRGGDLIWAPGGPQGGWEAGEGTGQRRSRAGGLVNCTQEDLPVIERCLHTVGI